ncbi:unnamed protein product, partial [Discosporangium mesarthrocarpum]
MVQFSEVAVSAACILAAVSPCAGLLPNHRGTRSVREVRRSRPQSLPRTDAAFLPSFLPLTRYSRVGRGFSHLYVQPISRRREEMLKGVGLLEGTRLGVGQLEMVSANVANPTKGVPAGPHGWREGPYDQGKKPLARVVLVAGFEAFNLQLYRQVAQELSEVCPELELMVFTDRDVAQEPEAVSRALSNADAFFGSLIFDYDQVKFLKERIGDVPVRLVFESALELMSFTQVGSFSMAQVSPPPPHP